MPDRSSDPFVVTPDEKRHVVVSCYGCGAPLGLLEDWDLERRRDHFKDCKEHLKGPGLLNMQTLCFSWVDDDGNTHSQPYRVTADGR